VDTLCGIGLPELFILLLIGFVVLGPDRTRELAIAAGRWLGRLLRSPWWGEFNQIADAIRNLPTTLVRMAELEETQAELRQTMADINRETTFPQGSFVPSPPSKQAQPATDPWGISDATASATTAPDTRSAAENEVIGWPTNAALESDVPPPATDKHDINAQ
jgi:Sec-independent protein translocase protein TatA